MPPAATRSALRADLLLRLILLLALLGAPLRSLAAGTGTIQGRVTDQETGEALIGAYVTVEGQRLGAVSDNQGNYQVRSVPPGRYRLSAQMIGYKTEIIRDVAVADSAVTVDIALAAQSIELETVTVAERRSRVLQDESKASVRHLRAADITRMAGGGEDLFRTLQALPGVVARADFASQFYVRGGTPDQNLIVVDGVTVFNPYRLKLLGGPVSMFNPDVVESVELLPGGFPAEYGDRLAAVLRVDNKEGDRSTRHFKSGVSLIDMRSFAEGPLPGTGGDGSWLAAARRTYYDLLLDGLGDLPRGTILPFFRDYQAKVVYDLGPKQKLQVNLLDSDEGMELKDLDVEEDDDEEFFTDQEKFSLASGVDNRLYSVGWLNAISDVTLSTLTLSHFYDTWSMEVEAGDQFFRALIDMRKLEIQEDLLHLHSREHTLQAGVAIADLITDITAYVDQDSTRYYEDNPDDRRAEDGRLVHRQFRLQNAATVSAFYAQDEWQRFAPLFKALIGLRLDHSTFTRRRVYSPRLSLTYMLSENLALRAGWGYFYQAPHFASLFERFEREIEWNLFETITLEPEKSVHCLAGLEWDRRQQYAVKLEGYYKFLDDLVVPTDSTFNNIPANTGEGFAAGAEFFAQKRPSSASRLSGWLSYSCSVTKERTPTESAYYRDFDQRHTLDLVARCRLTRRTSADVTYSFGSGFPWTPVIEDEKGQPQFDARGDVLWGRNNSRRYPAYRRLDVRLSWERDLDRDLRLLLYLEVINLQNRRNVFEYYWEDDYTRRRVSYMLPRMPFFGIKLEL